MKTIKIELTISDKEVLRDYVNTDPEIIGDDFCNNPESWLEIANLRITKNGFAKDLGPRKKKRKA